MPLSVLAVTLSTNVCDLIALFRNTNIFSLMAFGAKKSFSLAPALSEKIFKSRFSLTYKFLVLGLLLLRKDFNYFLSFLNLFRLFNF